MFYLDIMYIFLFYISLVESYQGTMSHRRLLDELLKDYTSELLPTTNRSCISLDITMQLENLIEINEKEQYMISGVYMMLNWTDHYLKWNATTYKATRLSISPKKIWRPDVVFLNMLENDDSKTNLDQSKNRVTVHYDGHVVWIIRKIIKTRCPLDVLYFPFDTQTCDIRMGSWTNDRNVLEISKNSQILKEETYANNAQWNLKNLSTSIYIEHDFSIVAFSVTIERRSLFYLVNLIVPTAILSFLALITFLLPAESGERMGLAITLLLSMVVFMLLITDMIPHTSENHPLVGIFFSGLFLEMALLLISLCYTMSCYHKEPNDPRMSSWMRKNILGSISYITGVRCRKEKSIEKEKLMINGQHDANNTGKNNQINYKELIALDNIDSFVESCKGLKNQVEEERILQAISNKLDIFLQRMKKNEDDETIKYEWRIVGLTIDRCLFICFVIVQLMIVIACYASSPGYVP